MSIKLTVEVEGQEKDVCVIQQGYEDFSVIRKILQLLINGKVTFLGFPIKVHVLIEELK